MRPSLIERLPRHPYITRTILNNVRAEIKKEREREREREREGERERSSFPARETFLVRKHLRGKKRVKIMSIEFSRLLLLLLLLLVYCRLDFFSLRFVWLCCLVSAVKFNNLSHHSSMLFHAVSPKSSLVTHYLDQERKRMREIRARLGFLPRRG